MTVLRGEVVKKVKAVQPAVFKQMDALSNQYGADVFRIAGQRYFNKQRERDALKREIADQQKRLRELEQKAAR